jgi:hypothetical protein
VHQHLHVVQTQCAQLLLQPGWLEHVHCVVVYQHDVFLQRATNGRRDR